MPASGSISTGRWVLSVTPCAARTSCISRASRPHERKRGFRGSRAVGSSWRGRLAGGRGTSAATSCHKASEGWRRKRCTSRWAEMAFSTLRWLEGSRVSPKSDIRGGKSSRDGSLSINAGAD